MFVRRRPLLRAAAVGGGAYAMGRRSARRQAEQSEQAAGQDARISNLEQGQGQGQGQGEGQAQPAAAGQPAPAAAGPSVSDQLMQLSQLHQQGALSDAEFATAKDKLLRG